MIGWVSKLDLLGFDDWDDGIRKTEIQRDVPDNYIVPFIWQGNGLRLECQILANEI
jgi:hypothetical protein